MLSNGQGTTAGQLFHPTTGTCMVYIDLVFISLHGSQMIMGGARWGINLVLITSSTFSTELLIPWPAHVNL